MKQRAIKIALTTIVLVGAFSGLLYSTLQDGTEYYKHVEEVMDKPSAWYGKKLQLHGFVVPNTIMRRRDSLDYRFRIQSNGAVVAAQARLCLPLSGRGVATKQKSALRPARTEASDTDDSTPPWSATRKSALCQRAVQSRAALHRGQPGGFEFGDAAAAHA